MRVRFLDNLGSIDAVAHGLDFKKCCKGMELDVADDAGKWLLDRNIAEDAQKNPVKGLDKPASVLGVPKKE